MQITFDSQVKIAQVLIAFVYFDYIAKITLVFAYVCSRSALSCLIPALNSSSSFEDFDIKSKITKVMESVHD